MGGYGPDTLRFDPNEIVGVDEQRGLFAVTMVDRDAEQVVVLRTCNTQKGADELAERVKAVLITWLEV